jgi:hypothetical protein
MCKASFGLAMAAGLAISWFFAVGVATAEPYKWCAQYGGSDEGGASNCGFVTIEQCRVTILGIGGFCVPNQFYTGPDVTPVNRTKTYRN